MESNFEFLFVNILEETVVFFYCSQSVVESKTLKTRFTDGLGCQ